MKTFYRALFVTSLALGLHIAFDPNGVRPNLMVGGPSVAVAQGNGNSDPNFASSSDAVSNQYIVTFAPGAYAVPDSPSAGQNDPNAPVSPQSVLADDGTPDGPTAASQICGQYSATLNDTYSYVGSFLITADEATARALSHDSRVVAVEANAHFYSSSVETNPGWLLDRIDQNNKVGSYGGPPDNRYTYFGTGSGVDAWIVDTGIDLACPDLGNASRIVQDFTAYTKTVNGRKVSDYSDDVGHGTFVADVLGGTQYGVAKAVRFREVKVLQGGTGSLDSIVAGLNYVKGHLTAGRPAVVNMSISFGKTTHPGSTTGKALRSAIDALIDKRVAIVVAAGNDTLNANTEIPSGFYEVITAGATDINDNIAFFSNYGDSVDVFAPGVGVPGYTVGGQFTTMDGTSFASPATAGVVALYLQANPTKKQADAENWITNNATYNRVIGIPSGTNTANRMLFSNL